MTDGLSPHIFLQEARDLLSEFESIGLDLEATPEDRDAFDRLLRSMHTISGSGAMFGFDAVASFTHHVEAVLDGVRGDDIAVSGKLVDLVMAAGDHIRLLLGEPGAVGDAFDISHQLGRVMFGLRPQYTAGFTP